MADLRVEDATLAQAQATFRTASGRIDPVARVVRSLSPDVVGADPLLERLDDADDTLAAGLGIIGQALAELAAHVDEVNTAFGAVDHALSQQLRAAR